MRRYAFIAVAVAVAAGGIAVPTAAAHADVSVVSQLAAAPPDLDGFLSPGEWSAATAVPFPDDPNGATAYVMNDGGYLYAALEYTDPGGGRSFSLYFDDDHSGTLDVGEDLWVADGTVGGGGDWFYNGETWSADGVDDTRWEQGFNPDNDRVVFEVAHRLCTAESSDICLTPGEVAGIKLLYHDFALLQPFTYPAGFPTAPATYADLTIAAGGIDPDDILVTNTNDSGPGSLRQAIIDANDDASVDADTIAFAIPGEGVQTIAPTSPLPAIVEPVTIDGYTQPGSEENASERTFTGKLQIVLTWPGLAWDGANAALALQTSDSTIRGILINGGFDTGISISGPLSNGNVVAGNLIGANQHCQITQARSTEGVTPSTITFTNQSGESVNVYWLDYDGEEVFYTSLADGASYLQETWLTHPWVIRTADGDCVGYELSDALAKTYVIQPPPVIVDDRVYGVRVTNGANGNTIGGSTPADRNVISGNTGFQGAGVVLDVGAVENEVAGNLIGTDGRGKSAVPNRTGVVVSDSSANVISDNVISGNVEDGITLTADAPNQTRFNEIERNLVGTDAGGALALGNGGDGIELRVVGENQIGETGEGDGEGNVVADSGGHGIFLFDSVDAVVENNYVGTDATGTVDLGNTIDGIAVDGGSDHLIRDNLTSGNTNQGIAIFRFDSLNMPSGVTVQDNRSGTNAAGTGPLPNGGHGILVARANNTTVGASDGRENTVAFNGGIGIAIAAEGTANRVRHNVVHDNGGLGIDLVPDGGPNGVTDNDPFDADTGPNLFQNFPVLTAVTPEPGGLIAVHGQLDSPAAPRTFTIDYYASAGCDPSGHGEGARHLGSHTFTIDRDDVGGPPIFTSSGIDAPEAGEVLTATATDSLNNTSEFSPCLNPESTVTISLTADATVEAGARRVRYADVPLSVFSRASAPTGDTTGSAPLDAIPLDAIPLDAIPLDAIPLDAIPLDAIPLDAIGLGSAVLDASLGGLPLTFVPLNPVSVPGGWDAILAQTALANRPTVTITLADVFGLDPLPEKPGGEPLSLADIDFSSSVLGDLPLAALVLGPIRLAEIPLDPQSTGEADNLADWCEAIDEQASFECSNATTLAQSTVMSTSLRGVPLDAIPLDAIPLDAIPLDAIPLDAIPLDAILLRGTPLDAIPLDAIPLDAIPLDAIPLDAIPLDAIGLGALPLDAIPLDAIPLDAIGLGNLPLDAIMATRSSPLDAIPLDAIPLDAIPLDAIGFVVNCNTYVCAGKTLGQAWRDGALLQGALLRHLDGALGQLTLADLGFYGSVSVGDLDHYGDVTLGQLREYGDLTLGELLAHVPGLTVGDVLLALLAPQAYPWEKLSYARLDPARYATGGSRVTYTGAFEIAGDATAAPVTVNAELPDGFSFVPGTATLESFAIVDGFPVSGITRIDDPAVDGDTLTFAFDSIARDADYTVRVEARPSIELGIGVGSATAQAGTGPESAVDTAETTVTETFPDNDDPDEAPEIAADSYYLSHVTGANDVDYYVFPVPDAGTRVTFHLSHLAADYDLAVYGPNRLAPPRDTTNEGIPLDGVPLADEPADLQPLAESLTPEALDDVPLLDDRPLWGLSINREKEDEAVVVVSNGEQGIEGELYYTIQVSGYNGASSRTPYMLRAQVQQPRELPDCLPRTLSLGQPGTSVNHLSTDLDTVFLVNVQRLRATYGADADIALNALQSNLAALETLGAKSAIIALDASEIVRNAYADWDANPCSPHLANRVVRVATDVLDGIRANNPALKHVVLVGGDDLVPHARIDDATTYANESQHAGAFRQSDQYLGAFANSKLLTDNPYGTVRPIPFFNRHLYVPELRVGRLVETPADIARALDAFVDFDGVLAPQTAFTTGYDFLSDGSQEVHDELDQLVGSAASRIDETWTSDDVRSALRATPPPAIASINAHYDHHRSLPASENAAGTEAALFTTADIRNPLTPDLDRRLLFTMGCHAGLSLSDVVVGATVPSLDWAQALGEKGASFAANTGFGLGDDEVVGYTERLLALFAQELRQAETIASALDRAKRRYLALQGVVGVYDEKVISQMTLYGLPMWRIRAGQQPPAPPQPPPTQTDPVTGLAASSFDVEPTFTRQPAGDAPRGNYYTVAGGDVQATHFRPLQPRLHLPVQEGAHGALVTTLASVDEGSAGGWFDPVYSRPTTDHSTREPEIAYGDTAFPTKIQTITRGPDGSSLVLLVGQFFTSDGAPAALGTQRRFTAVEGLVYSSTSDDWAPPRFDRIDAVKVGPQVAFTVDVGDPGGVAADVKRVYVLFRDAANVWHSVDLIRGAGTLWTGGAPLAGEQIEYFVQAVDAAGNVAVSTRKGRYFDARPAVVDLPAGLEVDLVVVEPGEERPNGWFTGAVDVLLTGPEPLEVSLDGGAFARYTSLRVSGDGVHTVDVRGPDELAATVVVPIDGTNPTATITSPAAGAQIPLGSSFTPIFACSDAGSGIASCTASSNPIDTTTIGTKTLTVTAVDAAGNTTIAQRSYSVVFTFEGFFPPVDNLPVVNVVKAGQSIPVKFSLHGNQGLAIFAAGYPKSQQVACAAGAPSDLIETVTSGNSNLTYSAGSDTYTYVWKTDSKWANTCRELIVRFADGLTERRALFQLKK